METAVLILTGPYCLVFETDSSCSSAFVLQFKYGILSLAAKGGCMQFLCCDENLCIELTLLKFEPM